MSTDSIIQQLRALAQSAPELKSAAQIYEIILPILREADPSSGSGQALRVTPIKMPAEYAREKLGQGIPLLRGGHRDDSANRLYIDPGSARDLLIQLARALEKIRPAAKAIREALERKKIDAAALIANVFANERDKIDAIAQELRLDPGLFWTLAQNAAKPTYRNWARQFGGLPLDVDWERAECFVCGDIAILAELQGNDQERHLRCGRCGADWTYRRLRCIYCGNENPKTLGTLYAEETRNKLSAQTCEVCKGYVKMIAAFSPNSPEMLVVQDLSSLPLDFIAQKNGYKRLNAFER